MTIKSSLENKTGESSFILGYRSDIEGLRAIAILLVIASHAGIPLLQGGYIGVDIFFVLSGYLITALLLQEFNETGNINFLNFYIRRLKRLLPALLFMILVTSFIASVVLAPIEQTQQAITAGYASVWLSNLYFAFSNFGYFEQTASDSMFLHTWSLGVEEQFYLVWPLLIVFFIGAWEWQGAKQNFTRLLYAMIGIIIICFLFSMFLSITMPLWGFYLMPSRAWQFALGALVLILSTKNNNIINISHLSISKRVRYLLNNAAWLGLISIFATAIIIDLEVNYSGVVALFPSIGTALILAAGSTENKMSLTNLISIKPFQWIGRISYSWYLWHWSVLVLGNTIYHYSEFSQNLILVLISLLLATFSYFFVESPVRKNKWLSSRNVLVLFSSILLMAMFFLAATIWQNSSKTWARQADQSIYLNIRSDLPKLYSMGCDEWFSSARVKLCNFGASDAEHTVVLIGDSIVAQWFPVISSVYNKKNWKVIVITKSSCPMIDEAYFYKRIGREYKECSLWRDTAVEWIKENKPDIVYMGNNHVNFDHLQWVNGTIRILEKLTTSVKDIFIIRPTYILPFDGPLCLSRQQWQSDFMTPQSDCSAEVGSIFEDNVFKWLNEAVSYFNNAYVINMNSVICPDNQCNAISMGGGIIFRDKQHLSSAYVKSLEKEFLREMKLAKSYSHLKK